MDANENQPDNNQQVEIVSGAIEEFTEPSDVELVDNTKDHSEEEEVKDAHLSMGIVQKEENGNISFETSIKFTLPADKESNADFVIGTAISNLFDRMQLAKSMRTKLFDSRKPLYIQIESEHFTLNLGKIEQRFLAKLKLNNGERSKLLFLDSIVALTNNMLAPVIRVRASELRESTKIAAQLRYNKPVKGTLSSSGMEKLSRTDLSVLAVAENGVLN